VRRHNSVPVKLRPALSAYLTFCRRIEHETMWWIVDKLFGWKRSGRSKIWPEMGC
jgi:hypothetical protein